MDNNLFQKLTRSAQEQYLLQNEILQGKFGNSGDHFMTTRDLADLRGISTVTAHNIMNALREANYIELRGNKYYLSYSKVVQEQKSQDKTFGLIVPYFNNDFFSSLSDAVVEAARQSGYQTVVMPTSYSTDDERKAHESLIKMGAEGILSCVPPAPESIDLYRNSPVPCVLLAYVIDEPVVPCVQVNNFSVSQKAARHLIEQGYKNFIYVGTKVLPIKGDIRFNAFNMELKYNNYHLEEKNIFQLATHDDPDVSALAEALERHKEPVGVFCFHDLIAAQLYRLCFKLNKRIPEDVGIVGFDDLPIASSMIPPMTSIQYRITSMAETAINLLLTRIKNPQAHCDNFYIEPTLVARQSSALSKSPDPLLIDPTHGR